MTPNRIVQGDALEVLRGLPDKSVDLVLTDPPYGLGDRMQGGTWGAAEKYAGLRSWDVAPSAEVFERILAVGRKAIIWGGNYFALPPSRCLLVWDKQNAVATMADCEMAWTNLDRPAKRFSYPVGRHDFGHPTQKPLALMEWCLSLVPDAETVLDCYAGSGTTGAACVRMGRRFFGIEIDPRWVRVGNERIEAEERGLKPAELRIGQGTLL